MNDVANLPAVMETRQSSVTMSFAEMQRLAESVAKSRLFGLQTADQALTLMAIAQAEGRHPALAARDYDIIQGRPAKKAEAMQRDFLVSGGKIEWLKLGDTEVEARFSHAAGGSITINWDMKRAHAAGLDGKDNWKKFPRQMLRSRVVSEGVRTVFPAATSGMYVPEEVAEFGPSRSAPIDVTPKADLDAFAAEVIDPATGEVFPSIADRAEALARDGTEAFRAGWKEFTTAERHQLREGLGRYQQIAQDADTRAAVERDHNEDPFGLPPSPSPQPKGGDRNTSVESPHDHNMMPPSLGTRATQPHSPADATNTKGEHSMADAPAGEPAQAGLALDAGDEVDPKWLGYIHQLGPNDPPDWPGYADMIVAACARTNQATRGTLQTSKMPALQQMRREAGDHYRRVMDALAGRPQP